MWKSSTGVFWLTVRWSRVDPVEVIGFSWLVIFVDDICCIFVAYLFMIFVTYLVIFLNYICCIFDSQMETGYSDWVEVASITITLNTRSRVTHAQVTPIFFSEKIHVFQIV